jgi:hypothetical protein
MRKTSGKRHSLSVAILATAVFGLSAAPAWAAEGGAGVYLPGTFGPQTGILPEPGTYATNYSYYYTAEAARVGEGGLVRSDLKVDVFSNFTSLTHVTY